MNFENAFTLMKTGKKMKRPSWEGYWAWDRVKQTILMHCRADQSDNGKPVLDIRETMRVEFTLGNILAEDWVVATPANCRLLGGEVCMSFGEALNHMRRYNRKIARKGWNGKSQYLTIGHNIHYSDCDAQNGVLATHDTMGHDAIVFHGTSGTQVGWLASQADMLSDDWIFID